MPKNYPRQAKFMEQFRQMAEEVKSIQGKDGLWRSGLLDPDAYELPEVSGSAFFTYAIAYRMDWAPSFNRTSPLPIIKSRGKEYCSTSYTDGG